MKEIYKYIFILFLLLLEISQIKTKYIQEKIKNEKIDIKIKSIELPQLSCIPNLSSFIYHIKVEFSKSPDITKTINIILNSKIKSICYPFENTTITDSFLQCKIDVVDYPIKNENLYLPLEAPNSDEYNFINWKEKMGEKPESNKISDKEIYCIPKELNSFKITETKNEGCSDNNNILSMKGEWNDENKLIPNNFEFSFDKMKGICNIISIKWIQCDIEGKGNIQFSDNFYFKYKINTFKIEKNEKIIEINDCINLCLFIFYRKLFLCLLLLLL